MDVNDQTVGVLVCFDVGVLMPATENFKVACVPRFGPRTSSMRSC
jgi:hypothetical protein